MNRTLKTYLLETTANPIATDRDETDTYESDYSQDSRRKVKTFPSKLKQRAGGDCECRSGRPKNVTFSFRDDRDATLQRQQLELNLSNAQLDESVASDAHHDLQARNAKVASTLASFSCYMDAVGFEMKACSRLCDQLNGLIYSEKALTADENLLDATKNICDGADRGLADKIRSNLHARLDKDGGDLAAYVDEYKDRKDDFKIATQNFRTLLGATDLRAKQLDKLQRQYDKILVNYQHSRCMLDRQISVTIETRIGALLTCFCEFSEDLGRLASARSNMSQLFQNFEAPMVLTDDLTLKLKLDNDGAGFNGDVKVTI